MSFIRRVFGRGAANEGSAENLPEPAPEEDEPRPTDPAEATQQVTCPYCAYPLDPPPERSRRCPSCRQLVVVRRIDGRTVFLVESAVPVFDRERQRVIDLAGWTTDREHWLALAEGVRAPAAEISRLSDAELSADVVEAARALYIAHAESAARTARRAKRWTDVARIRRQEASATFRAAGSPVPPPDDLVALHREGMFAELRALTPVYAYAELVSAGCCRPCRADDGKVFKIAAELREARLPHDGCPKGLCGCEWFLAMPTPKRRRRTTRKKPTMPAEEPVSVSPEGAETVDSGSSEGGTRRSERPDLLT